jgi:cytochrome c biogenesis protein CcdA
VAALIVFVVSVAFVDSLNPTTVVPALYLAAAPGGAAQVIGFTAGVFGVSAVGGIVIALGPGRFLVGALSHVSAHTAHVAELVAGLALIVLAAVLWRMRDRVARHVRVRPATGARSALLLGAGIMAVELPTALPYFAAIAAIVAEVDRVVVQVALVLLFNLVFVAPLLTIAVARQLAGDRGTEWGNRAVAVIEPRIGALLPLVVLAIGVGLTAYGAAKLIAG